MQNTTPQVTEKIKPIQPAMDFDLDDFSFKPVTKGLGFHHESKVDKPVRTQSYRTPTNHYPRLKQEPIHRESVSVNLNTAVKENTIKEDSSALRKKIKTARMGLQFTSFIFDLVILFSIQISLNFLFLKFAKLSSMSQFIQFTWIEQAIFFSFIYLFYFTLLDLVASPGKRIFSIRLKSTTSKKVRIDQTLIRAVVTLLSFATFLMPLIFDFQGKLSDTRLVEDA